MLAIVNRSGYAPSTASDVSAAHQRCRDPVSASAKSPSAATTTSDIPARLHLLAKLVTAISDAGPVSTSTLPVNKLPSTYADDVHCSPASRRSSVVWIAVSPATAQKIRRSLLHEEPWLVGFLDADCGALSLICSSGVL